MGGLHKTGHVRPTTHGVPTSQHSEYVYLVVLLQYRIRKLSNVKVCKVSMYLSKQIYAYSRNFTYLFIVAIGNVVCNVDVYRLSSTFV